MDNQYTKVIKMPDWVTADMLPKAFELATGRKLPLNPDGTFPESDKLPKMTWGEFEKMLMAFVAIR